MYNIVAVVKSCRIDLLEQLERDLLAISSLIQSIARLFRAPDAIIVNSNGKLCIVYAIQWCKLFATVIRGNVIF